MCVKSDFKILPKHQNLRISGAFTFAYFLEKGYLNFSCVAGQNQKGEHLFLIPCACFPSYFIFLTALLLLSPKYMPAIDLPGQILFSFHEFH